MTKQAGEKGKKRPWPDGFDPLQGQVEVEVPNTPTVPHRTD